MFGTLGGPEVILILVVALIVFGPRRLPEIGKSMGKMLAAPAPIPAPEVTPGVSDVGATDATTAAVPEAAAPPELAAAPVPTFEGADASGTPESEPRVERPAEPVVSRDHSADKS